jgi:leucyl-tRNA synthetase
MIAASTMYSDEHSKLSTDWDKESAMVHANFKTFVQKWLLLMKEKGCTIVGYALQAEHLATGASRICRP